MATEFFDTTWGRIRLWCSSIETTNSRTLVVHELAVGDLHPIHDRGLAPKKARCSLLFDEMPNEPKPPDVRLLEFIAQVDQGDEQIFTHPLLGSYLAKVGDFTWNLDEDGNIVDATAEFIADDQIIGVHAGIGSQALTGTDAVAARAAELNAALESVDIASDLPAKAVAFQESWIEPELVPTRQVFVESSEIATLLTNLIDENGLEDDLEYFDAYRAAIMFGAAVRDAAIAVTSETPSIFFVKVSTPTPLLALVAKIYGGSEAADREVQVRSLNDIRFVGGLIATGTELAMPQKSTLARLQL